MGLVMNQRVILMTEWQIVWTEVSIQCQAGPVAAFALFCLRIDLDPPHVSEEKGHQKYNFLKAYSRMDMSDNTIYLLTFTEMSKNVNFRKR